MRRASQPEEEEAIRDEGIVQADPIIVEHPAKPDPKLLDTVLKVIFIKLFITKLSISIDRLLERNLN